MGAGTLSPSQGIIELLQGRVVQFPLYTAPPKVSGINNDDVQSFALARKIPFRFGIHVTAFDVRTFKGR